MNIPLNFPANSRDLEEELNGAGAVVSFDEDDFRAVNFDRLAKGQGDEEPFGDSEDSAEECGGGGGREDDAAGPGRGEAGVVVGVEVREEVGHGKGPSVAECVDEEACVGDEFGAWDGGGNGGEGK